MSLLRASILGGVDGVITSFAIISGSQAGELGNDVINVVGLSSLLADGFSMGVSEYLSSDAVQGSTGGRAGQLGLACFTSFILWGLVPLLTFFVTENLLSTAMFSLVELMILGSWSTRFNGMPLLRGFFQTTILGAAAGGISFAVGRVVHHSL